MTEPPQGRERSPSVAALAIHVNGLRRDIESLASKVEALTSTQAEHAAALDDIAELRQQVEQILAILGEASPAEWFWLRMSDQVRDDKLSELLDWVETVLRQQYPDYLARPGGSCPGCISSGPSPTWRDGQHRETPRSGMTAGPPACSAA